MNTYYTVTGINTQFTDIQEAKDVARLHAKLLDKEIIVTGVTPLVSFAPTEEPVVETVLNAISQRVKDDITRLLLTQDKNDEPATFRGFMEIVKDAEPEPHKRPVDYIFKSDLCKLCDNNRPCSFCCLNTNP